MAMRRYEIQKIYLEIQQNIGLLELETTPINRKHLNQISVELLRVKRNMIGVFDEIEADVKLG